MGKRLAVQLFGHLRTFEHTFASLQDKVLLPNTSDGYSIDFFIHTWDELDHTTVNYRNPDGNSLGGGPLLPQYVELATKLYAPKGMAVEPQRDYPDVLMTERVWGGRFKRSIRGCFNMAYSLYRSSELRRSYAAEHGIEYDWVIVTRPDIFFKTELRLDEVFGAHAREGFEIPPKGLFYAFNPFGCGQMIEEPQFLTGADLLYVAMPENVDAATSLYPEFAANIDVDNFYCMEVWWGDFWRRQGLTPYPLNYRHGPDFDVIKTADSPILPQNRSLSIKHVIKKCLLYIVPYALAKKIFHSID